MASLGATALLLASSALAAGQGSVAASDRKFATEAASGGLLEVAAGKLAQQQGQDPKIKEFGQRMVADHTKANQQLQSLASSKGIQLPSTMGGKHQAMYDRLQKLSGTEFDCAYGRMMAADHREDVR